MKIRKLLHDFDEELLEHYDRVKTYAQKSDIARYVIVYLYGGIYLDTDFQCIKNIGNLFGDNVDMFYIPFKDILGMRVFNGVFGAKRNHEMLRITIDNMKKRLRKGGSVPFTTGTILLYNSITEYHNKYPYDDTYILFSDLQLLPCSMFQKQDVCDNKWRNVSYMTHMNDGSWNIVFDFLRIFVQYKEIIICVIVIFTILVLLLVLWGRKIN